MEVRGDNRPGWYDPAEQVLRRGRWIRKRGRRSQAETDNRKKEAEEYRRQLKLRRRRCRWYNERHGSISQTGIEGIFQRVRVRGRLGYCVAREACPGGGRTCEESDSRE